MQNKIYLQNTLGKTKQEFTPINPKEVRLYSCGPTVYNYAHIGNLRAYVFADTLKRVLQYNDFRVRHIMNVTDVGHLTSDADQGDDKMVKALKREGKEMTLKNMREVANFYFEAFRADLKRLNIIEPASFPFASDHIKEDVEMIQTLIDKQYAYRTSDGIYFDTARDTHYGRLGGIAQDNDHGRIESNSEKKNYRDFALWKFSDGTGLGFEAPFARLSSPAGEINGGQGDGFPGWHIECSAMVEKYLGTPIDIHTGGIDHIPVHHNNEIAQTECATGHGLSNFWMHNAHITINKDKMAKSGENFVTLDSLSQNNISPITYRYWLLTARYSTRVDYSLEAIASAQVGFEKLHTHFGSLGDDIGQIHIEYKNRFIEAINNDLDTPKALAILWEMIKDTTVKNEDKKATLLDFDRVLGLGLGTIKIEERVVPDEILKLINERKEARANKDWAKADELRTQIENAGFEVRD